MNLNKMYGLFLRHFYLIKSSLPRVLDLIYWPTIQIILWGFISKFFSIYSEYYNNTLGVILTCAILYDILFRSSISFNMLFLEEIWSRNFTNLFIAPLKIKRNYYIFNFYSFNKNFNWIGACNYFNFSIIWSFNFKIRFSSFYIIFKFIYFWN